MLKQNYYCLVAGLPDLFFNENKKVTGSAEFCEIIKNDIAPDDYEIIKLILLPSDNQNLLQLLFTETADFSNQGNFTKTVLEEQIIKPNLLPHYMAEFIKWLKEKEHKDRNLEVENKLQSLFYNFVLKNKNQFLNQWFFFELNIKNIITATNCNRFNYNTNEHLIEVGQNSEVNALLLKNRFKPDYYEDEVPYANEIFRVAESESELIEKEKILDRIKWDYLDEMTFFHYFTIEKIVSFVLKLQISERWLKLDKQTGQELLNKIINEIKTSYSFPAEFSMIK